MRKKYNIMIYWRRAFESSLYKGGKVERKATGGKVFSFFFSTLDSTRIVGLGRIRIYAGCSPSIFV
jgi:hypothetical protein